MDNDAFKTLVRNRAQIKSTKQIAREAVEAEERRKKKKRKRGGGGDSSSEEEEEDRRRAKTKDDRPQFMPRSVPTALQLSTNYRDRAKERREGRREKEDDFTEGASDEVSRENGLDLLMAREIKGALQKTDKVGSLKSGVPVTKNIPTVEEAYEILRNATNGKLSIELGTSLSDYIHKLVQSSEEPSPKQIRCGIPGKSIQRSLLVFALDGNPSDYVRAWEIPREATNPNPNYERYNKARLDVDLIAQIAKSLRRQRRDWAREDQHATEASDRGHDYTAAGGDNENQSDDDDIFGGLDEYVPPAPKKSPKND